MKSSKNLLMITLKSKISYRRKRGKNRKMKHNKLPVIYSSISFCLGHSKKLMILSIISSLVPGRIPNIKHNCCKALLFSLKNTKKKLLLHPNKESYDKNYTEIRNYCKRLNYVCLIILFILLNFRFLCCLVQSILFLILHYIN